MDSQKAVLHATTGHRARLQVTNSTNLDLDAVYNVYPSRDTIDSNSNNKFSETRPGD